MKEKIGFVINAPLKYSETFLLREFRLLEEKGFEIIVFEGYSQDQKTYPFKRIKALPFKMNTLVQWIYALKVLGTLFFIDLITCIRFVSSERHSGTSMGRTFKRIWFSAHILSYKVDYLHFCFADVAIQKELVAKAIKAQMSVSLRGSDIILYPRKNKDCYFRLWKYAEKIHVVSNWILEQALLCGLPKDKKVQVIHDGIDPEIIPYNASDIHDPLRIVSIGRLEPVKDHHFALEVIHQLVVAKVNLHYSIIGDGAMRESLLSRIKELQLEKYVQLNGKENHKELVQHLGLFDLLLHTSTSEGLGVSLLEAQASGLLVVSLDSGGTEESIEDGKSGWIVRKRIPEYVANKITEILKQEPLQRGQVKDYARRRIETHFNIQNNAVLWSRFFSVNHSMISQ